MSWLDLSLANGIVAAAVSGNTVSAPTTVTTTAAQDQPSISWDAWGSPLIALRHFGLVWADLRSGIASSSDIYGARLSISTAPLSISVLPADGTGVLVVDHSSDAYAPQIGCNGFRQCLIAWQQHTTPTNIDIRGRIVTNLGVDWSMTSEVGVGVTAMNEYSPRIASDKYNYFVTYTQDTSGTGHDVLASRVRGIDPPFVIDTQTISAAAGSQDSSGVAFVQSYFGPAFYSVYSDNQPGLDGYDVMGTATLSDGNSFASDDLTFSANAQADISIAFNGIHYLAVWSEYRLGTDYDILATRIDPSTGTILDDPPIVIAGGAGDDRRPRVAASTWDFMVTWSHFNGSDNDVLARGVDSSASLGPTLTVAASSVEEFQPVAGWANGYYLLAWSQVIPGTNYAELRAARVTTYWVYDPGGLPIATPTSSPAPTPGIACGPSNCLVVYHDRNASGFWQVQRTIVTDTSASARAVVATSTMGSNMNAVAAYGAGTYMAAWQGYNSAIMRFSTYAGTISTGGAVGAPVLATVIPPFVPAFDETVPSIAFDGTNFGVLWEDMRRITGPSDYVRHGFMNRMTSSGVLIDTGGDTQVTLTGLGGRTPALAASSVNAFRAGYHRFDATAGVGSNRVFTVTVSY